jgi:hypothetical protein
MIRTQIQFPGPLYRRIKQVAESNDWPLAEVVRRATELYVGRFAERQSADSEWSFPTLDISDNFLRDPADVQVEHDAINLRSR